MPVVASNVGGLPEVVRDGETGALVTSGDTEAMASQAIAILRDTDRWHAMSQLAASDARERFGIDQIVAQYEAFYQGNRQ